MKPLTMRTYGLTEGPLGAGCSLLDELLVLHRAAQRLNRTSAALLSAAVLGPLGPRSARGSIRCWGVSAVRPAAAARDRA